ncbi:nickel pincer cofactor biosynthesis protein LarC [Schaedlerella arabinosiphila]|uniref:nickel pincer cofactor biosynthesis protein LarC n=1 Tax=Schaedlerella arabinosiphila TaxID=2044587 RepID=UPI0025582823|nr:nickel pincer cofactor biosynthesis protein LarC [Schaedlerella arabinosiphila]
MGNTLYLECSSGISGDMAVAALLDLGADQEVLKKAVASLPVEGCSIEISRVKKSGLDACDFLVHLDEAHENHDHDMEYLHGTEEQCRSHVHSHDQGEGHHTHTHFHGEHMHTHEGNSHGHSHEAGAHHTHRGLQEVLAIISQAELSGRAKETAVRIFTILAEAEAKAHGVPLEQVHFHEVGAVDSIVDIVAAAVCLDDLDITETVIPRICEGRGFVRCQHGVIPVPVPAVVNIAQANQLPLHLTETEGELVTPTGAAIAAAIRTKEQLPESFVIKKTGIGAGKRTYDRPSLLRAMLIGTKEQPAVKHDCVCRLETNIDDCTGETLGYVMERLFEAGARDVNYTPVYMKKNRPAYQLNVICSRESVPELESIIFRETTTIGIRKMEMERAVLERSPETVQTSLGEAEVKVCTLPSGEKRCYPEYAAAERLAAKNGISYQDAFEQIKRETQEKFR